MAAPSAHDGAVSGVAAPEAATAQPDRLALSVGAIRAGAGSTAAAGSPAEMLAKLRLTSTAIGRSFRSATINGRSRRVGDWVGPYRLTAIYPHSVVLVHRGERYRLSMRR